MGTVGLDVYQLTSPAARAEVNPTPVSKRRAAAAGVRLPSCRPQSITIRWARQRASWSWMSFAHGISTSPRSTAICSHHIVHPS